MYNDIEVKKKKITTHEDTARGPLKFTRYRKVTAYLHGYKYPVRNLRSIK